MEIRNNDMRENWIKWNPCGMPEGGYTVTSFVQDNEGTEIILETEENIITVFFNGITPIVRTSVEGIRLRTLGEVQEKYNNRFFFTNWFFYVVENSLFTNWAYEESRGCYESEEMTHYSIVTGIDIIDIISTFEPEMSITPVVKQYLNSRKARGGRREIE